MRYLLVLLLAGCATHPVHPYGDGSYIVTASDVSILGSRGKSEARVLRAANEHCAKMGLRMQPKESGATGNVWTGTSGRLVFTCTR